MRCVIFHRTGCGLFAGLYKYYGFRLLERYLPHLDPHALVHQHLLSPVSEDQTHGGLACFGSETHPTYNPIYCLVLLITPTCTYSDVGWLQWAYITRIYMDAKSGRKVGCPMDSCGHILFRGVRLLGRNGVYADLTGIISPCTFVAVRQSVPSLTYGSRKYPNSPRQDAISLRSVNKERRCCSNSLQPMIKNLGPDRQ